MAKRDRNKGGKNGSDQTKSETTTAAHVVFNDPEQPKAPVTTDNMTKTVKQAVHEEVAKAFAEKERQDLSQLRSQAPITTQQATSKPKVRMKATVNDVPEEKINTPTGVSINELAERIQKQEEPVKTVKPKVKLKTPTPFNTVPSEQRAVPMVSKTVASKSAVLEQPKAEQVSNPQNLNVEGLVKRMAAEDQTAKVEKTVKPMTADERKQSRSDAAQALASMGFKKAEFQKLLDRVDHIDDTTEKIRYALKLQGDPHAKIPKAELPAAVEEARKEVKLPIKVEPAKSEEPKAPPVVKKDKPVAHVPDPNAPEQLTLFKQTPTQTATAAPVPAPVPAVPAKTPMADPDAKAALDQAQAVADKAKEEEEKKEKAQKERDKRIEKQLKEIQDKIGSKGIFDLIAEGISGLLKSLIPTLLRPLLGLLPSMLGVLGRAGLVIGVGVAAYEGAKFLLEKVGYTGETLGRFFSGQDAKYAAQEAKFNKYENSESIIGRLNDKLKGTGFTALGAGQYKDAQGHTVKAVDLPPDIQSKINLATTKAVAAPTAVASKLEAQAPKAQSAMASEKITPPPQSEVPESPEVHVHQDNRQTNVLPQQRSSNDGGALIKVRNDEPTAAGLIASIFEHPVSYGGVYRM